MSVSSLSQLEDEIQGLSLHDKLGLLEWLVKAIRMQTGVEPHAARNEPIEAAKPNGTPSLSDGIGAVAYASPTESEEHYDVDAELRALVARIKATPPNPEMIIHPTKSFEEVAERWAAETPTEDDIPPDEWDRLWTEFEAELKAADRANDIAEGRL